MEQSNRLGTDSVIRAFAQRVTELGKAALSFRRAEFPPALDLDPALWIGVTATECLTIRYVLERPAIPRDQFLDDLTRLLVQFTR